MEGLHFSPSRALEKDASRVIFARDAACTTCPDAAPTCPTCPSGQSCQVTVPLVCSECPKAYCAQDVTSPASSSKSGSSSNSGAIAGGVVGGVALIAIVTYLIWRFCIKAKRQQMSKMEEDAEYNQQMDGSQSFATRRGQRASTHTVHSIASTVLTRASNIIQIAYIPGVTNRAPPTSPGVLVPPVPPIPITISRAGASAGTEEQHFFVPGDLRDSTYSGYSAFTDRTSYARTSYAPRSSIASTIYGKNAVIVPPPQTGMRIKPTMVNLKSPSNLGPGVYTPPVPNVDFEKYKKGSKLRPVSTANSTFSVGSTFLNNASAATAMPVRPVVVRVGSKKSSKSVGDGVGDTIAEDDCEAEGNTDSKLKTETFSEKAEIKSSSSPPPPPANTANTARDSNTCTVIEDSPSPDQGPFSDPPATPLSEKTMMSGSDASQPASPTSASAKRNTGTLSAVMEEATSRASQKDGVSSSTERGRSPFGDENATQEN